MLQHLRWCQAMPNDLQCLAQDITGWTDIGISLVGDTLGLGDIGCFLPTSAGPGWLRDTMADVSSGDSGVAAGKVSTVDMAAMKIGINDASKSFRTGLGHGVDMDSGVVTIADPVLETGANAEAASC